MKKKATAASRMLVAVIFIGVFAGCPDRSMLREYPDLSKQSDSDSEEAVNDDPEQAESSDASSTPPSAETNK